MLLKCKLLLMYFCTIILLYYYYYHHYCCCCYCYYWHDGNGDNMSILVHRQTPTHNICMHMFIQHFSFDLSHSTFLIWFTHNLTDLEVIFLWTHCSTLLFLSETNKDHVDLKIFLKWSLKQNYLQIRHNVQKKFNSLLKVEWWKDSGDSITVANERGGG